MRYVCSEANVKSDEKTMKREMKKAFQLVTISFCFEERLGLFMIKWNELTYEHPPNKPTQIINMIIAHIGIQ